MSKLQLKKEESVKQHVKIIPQNQVVASSSIDEDSSSDFSRQLNSLRNPEARKLVIDFQKNVYDLLVNKVKWRVKSRRNPDGSSTVESESLSSAAMLAKQHGALEYESELCQKFTSSLTVKDKGENDCIPSSRAAQLGPPVMFEVDDGGQMEFNPYKLVATIGQKLTLAAQLMDVIKDEKRKEMLAEKMQDKAVQTESVMEIKMDETEYFSCDEDITDCEGMLPFDC